MAGSGRVRPIEALIAPEVASTLAVLKVAPEDAGVARLARRYAQVIDDAALVAAELQEVYADVDPDDEATFKRIAALAARVGAQAVLSDLGPKLLAALDALGATPRARKAPKGGAGGQPSKLGAIRGSRRRPA